MLSIKNIVSDTGYVGINIIFHYYLKNRYVQVDVSCSDILSVVSFIVHDMYAD